MSIARQGKETILRPWRPGRGFVILMLALLAVPGPLQMALELARGERVSAFRVFGSLPTEQALRDFETLLEERSPLRQWARGSLGTVLERAFRRGNKRVVFGDSRWMFYRDGIRWVTAPAFDSERARRLLDLEEESDGGPVAVIHDFRRQLAERGIELVVVPVPTKATLHPERLGVSKTGREAPNNPALAGFLRSLKDGGVTVVDVTAAMLGVKREQISSAFLPRDTHWTPAAMAAAARFVGEEIERLGLLQNGELPRAEFDHRAVAFLAAGDLIAMTEGGAKLYEPMEFELRQVIATEDGRRPIVERGAAVLLLGDSLTNVFSDERLEMGRRGGFGEHLAAALGLPIEVIAMAGGGATRVRQTLARQPHRLASKRLVIWQFSQRDLLFARGGWRKVTLPSLLQSTGETPAVHEVELSTVARVDALTRLPPDLDYADCMIVLRYRYVDGDSPGDEDLFHVAHWGLRDWKRTEAASFTEGELRDLRLVPFRAKYDLSDTCWFDTTGLEGQLWWAEEVERR